MKFLSKVYIKNPFVSRIKSMVYNISDSTYPHRINVVKVKIYRAEKILDRVVSA